MSRRQRAPVALAASLALVVAGTAGALPPRTSDPPAKAAAKAAPLPAKTIGKCPPTGGKGDPAADRSEFQLVSKGPHPFKGRVRIVGVVKNVGKWPFKPRGSGLLYEDGKKVGAQSFNGLVVGQEVKVSYERDWFTQVNFKPTYKLVVTIDPDAREDNYSNNVKTRDGAEIDKLFAQAPKPPLRRLPDLVVLKASLRAADQTGPGQPVLWVTATVKKIGGGASAAQPSVGMVQAIHADNCGWGNGTGLPALKPGASHTVKFPVYYLKSNPQHMVGTQKFLVRVNAGKWVVESNHANNNFGPLTVTIASGLVVVPTVPRDTGPVGDGPAALLDLINQHRKANGKAVLTLDPCLAKAAQGHSEWMQATGTLSHTGKNGSSVADRLKAAGCPQTAWAENIAKAPTPEVCFNLWKNSPPHNTNMLGPYAKVGIGLQGVYWTSNFTP
jgi:uncharacterized protein YkwD